MKHLLLALALAAAAPAADTGGFVSMFNGRDLAGWTNINCAPETWTVRDGMIHCTGKPTGALRTLRHYENFIMEAEWRHLSSGGNSGIFMWGSPISAPGVPFLRAVEIQVLDHGYAEQFEKETGKKSDWFTTHGDVFPIHGSTMKPFGPHRGERSFPTEERSKRSPEWNHYRIVASNGVLRLSVNGKEVSGGEECNYRKGYLGLESEGAPVEFRNLRIKELPSSNPDASMVAPLDPGWWPLYNGADLRGWKDTGVVSSRWQSHDWQLSLQEHTNDVRHDLWTEAEFGNVELIPSPRGLGLASRQVLKFSDPEFTLDVKPGKTATGDLAPTILLRGLGSHVTELRLAEVPVGKWTRVRLQTKGLEAVVFIGDKEVQRLPLHPPPGAFGLKDTGAAVEFSNLHARKL